MKKLIYFLALVGMSVPMTVASVAHAQEAEQPNYHSVDAEKGNLPQTIVIKKDKDGKISVFKSSEAVAEMNNKNAANLEKLPFESLDGAKGLKVENLSASVNELDVDKPRQSWYWYGYGYGYGYYNPYSYYYPVYYYNYSYYPYYYYGYNGCSYYYYSGCGRGYC